MLARNLRRYRLAAGVGEPIEQVTARLGDPYDDRRKTHGDGGDRYELCIGIWRGHLLRIRGACCIVVECGRVATTRSWYR